MMLPEASPKRRCLYLFSNLQYTGMTTALALWSCIQRGSSCAIPHTFKTLAWQRAITMTAPARWRNSTQASCCPLQRREWAGCKTKGCQWRRDESTAIIFCSSKLRMWSSTCSSTKTAEMLPVVSRACTLGRSLPHARRTE